MTEPVSDSDHKNDTVPSGVDRLPYLMTLTQTVRYT